MSDQPTREETTSDCTCVESPKHDFLILQDWNCPVHAPCVPGRHNRACTQKKKIGGGGNP